MKQNYDLPKKVRYTEAGHVYMSSSEALLAILNGEKNWCTSNFLRGLFMMKLLLGCFCGIITCSLGLDVYKYHWLFLALSILFTYLLVVVKCKIDVQKVFHSPLKPYTHRLVHAYAFYFISYLFTSWASSKIQQNKPIFQ